MLLEQEDGKEDVTEGGRSNKTQHKQRQANEKPFYFKLKHEDKGKGISEDTQKDHSRDLKLLQEMFGDVVDVDLLTAVYLDNNNDLEKSIQVLLHISSPPPDHQPSTSQPSLGASAPVNAGTEAGAVSRWDNLDPDVKHTILTSLSPVDLARVARVNRALASWVRHNRRKKHRLALPPGLCYRGIVGLVVGHVAVQHISFHKLAGGDSGQEEAALCQAVLAVAEACQKGGQDRHLPVHSLGFKGLESLTDQVLLEVCRSMPHLAHLDLTGCRRLTSKSLLLLSKYHTIPVAAPTGEEREDYEATSLDIVPQDPSHHPSLSPAAGREVEASATGAEIGGPSSSVESPSTRLAGLEVKEVWDRVGGGPTSSRGLQSLNISKCSGIDDFAIRALLDGPHSRSSLTHLDMSHCARLSQKALVLPPTGILTHLKAASCKHLTKVVLQLPDTHPLSTLNFNKCVYLTELVLVAANLKMVNLSACRTLSRLSLRCPRLEELSLALCISFWSLDAERWQVPALKKLNMFACRRLGDSDGLADVLSRLPALQHINLNGCWSLRHLNLSGNLDLEELDVSGCSQLHALEVSSQVLRKCSAVSCTSLTRLSLQSAQLATLNIRNCPNLQDLQLRCLVEGQQGSGRKPQVEADGCLRLPREVVRRLEQ